MELGEATEHASAFASGSNRIGSRLLLVPLTADGTVVGILALAYELGSAEAPPAREPPTLTPRQYEVLKLLGAARTTQQIADELGLSTETVRNHVRAVLRELGARSRLQAVVIADRLGMLRPDAPPTTGP
jgi:DNA-binding NarL/FixJ family response regulator